MLVRIQKKQESKYLTVMCRCIKKDANLHINVEETFRDSAHGLRLLKHSSCVLLEKVNDLLTIVYL